MSEEYKFTLDSKSQYDAYIKSITEISTLYDNRIVAIEQEEQAQKQAELAKQNEAKRTYSNEFSQSQYLKSGTLLTGQLKKIHLLQKFSMELLDYVLFIALTCQTRLILQGEEHIFMF